MVSLLCPVTHCAVVEHWLSGVWGACEWYLIGHRRPTHLPSARQTVQLLPNQTKSQKVYVDFRKEVIDVITLNKLHILHHIESFANYVFSSADDNLCIY